MQKSMILAASAAFIVSGSVFAQDIPDPNPVQNTDGTFTWSTVLRQPLSLRHAAMPTSEQRGGGIGQSGPCKRQLV